MGKASRQKARKRLAGSGSEDLAERVARWTTPDQANLHQAVFAGATALIDKALGEDDTNPLELAIVLLASVGKHYVFDTSCDVDYGDGNGPQKRTIIEAAFELDAINVCEFLCGAMSRYPESALYQSMVALAVAGLDVQVHEARRNICESWARWEFDRVDPVAMSPAERSDYCGSFGPNACRVWWEVAGKLVADDESSELDAEILTPAPARSRARAAL